MYLDVVPAPSWLNSGDTAWQLVAATLVGLMTVFRPRDSVRNYLTRVRPFSRIDDTLGVMHTHLIAGAIGGLMVGRLANPSVIVYPGTGKTPAVAVSGLFFGNPKQFVAQVWSTTALRHS
jgi:ammonium transporter, Amt family